LEICKPNNDCCKNKTFSFYYLVLKIKSTSEAKDQVKNLLQLFDTTHVNKKELESALYLKISGYEDAVLHESAIRENFDGIVTRNTKDFKNSKLTVYDPEGKRSQGSN